MFALRFLVFNSGGFLARLVGCHAPRSYRTCARIRKRRHAFDPGESPAARFESEPVPEG